jgi:shikimate kinase
MISLIGMPGVGKTSVGRRLARLIGRSFVDSDHEIERRLGMPIVDFFREHGEAAFRDIEQEVVEELARRSDHVLATGGGAILREPNRLMLRNNGTVVYLRTTPRRLVNRTRNANRPLLQGHDPLARLEQLFKERSPLYEATAEFSFDVYGGSSQRMAEAIAERLGCFLDCVGAHVGNRGVDHVGAAPVEQRPGIAQS